jgi:hypothetical protein
MLDGIEIKAEEKVKAENLHGVDLADRETIFKALLPQEEFVDRRLNVYEDIEEESDDQEATSFAFAPGAMSQRYSSEPNNGSEVNSVARNYVGELIQQVAYINGKPEFHETP